MNILQIENELVRLKQERKEAIDAHEKFMDKNTTKINVLLRKKQIVMTGIDLEKVITAESILYIEGLRNDEYSDRCVTKAIEDIATGKDEMKERYFGVKNYAHWVHQESDHPYGYGPKHGSIVFSVGYRRNYLRTDLTDEQKESCLYYLNLLRDKSKRESLLPKKVTV